jgi:hypothetical protein
VVATGGDSHAPAQAREVATDRSPEKERGSVPEVVQPPGGTGGVVTQSGRAQTEPGRPKRRGFWGRIFGRRDDAPNPQPSTPRSR